MEFIGDHAFFACTVWTEVDLPETIQYIGENAFDRLDSMKSFIVRAVIPPILDKGTMIEKLKINIVVPQESLDAYLSHDDWGKRTSKIVGVELN